MALAQQSQTWFPTHVQVTVLQAKALRTKGKAGTNDAYCIIQLGKEKYSTSVAEKSLAPLWKEEATFELPLLHQGNQERCTIYVIVMHRALVGLDKFLGQAALNLWELHQDRSRRKTQWYKLQSKPGKKQKERGQVEIDVQFMRNNMTASMFDLSMKEKSLSPFRKLKDKIKRKPHDGLPDTASAIVPSITRSAADSDEEIAPQKEKKKNKIKTLFSKPGLQKNSLSQSMSVLPTFQPVPAASEKTVLRPSDFRPSLGDEPQSPKSDNLLQNKTEGRSSKLPHLPVILSHKRTVSADPNQMNQMTLGNTKKEGLSFFSGLRSKNDPITRSNLCINGNHVYMEETEPKNDTIPKDNSLSSSPLALRKTPVYASAENLSSRSLEAVTTADIPADKSLPRSVSKDSLKTMTMPAYKPSGSEESWGSSVLASFHPPKETEEKKQENKKPPLEESQDSSAPVNIDPPMETKESKKSSLLSFVTGKKDVAKNNEDGLFTEVSLQDKATPDAPKKESEAVLVADAPSKKNPFNPFDEDLTAEEKKPAPPLASARAAKTTAVKPRLDVSSEDETKAKLASASFSLPTHLSNDPDDPFSLAPKLAKEIKPQDSENLSSLHSTFTPLDISLSWSFHSDSVPFSKERLDDSELPKPQNETFSNKHNIPTRIFSSGSERSFGPSQEKIGITTKKPYEVKDVQIVTPFVEKSTSGKSSVKSLLDELKGKRERSNSEQDAEPQDGSLLNQQHKEKSSVEQTESSLGKLLECASVSDDVYTPDNSSLKTKVIPSAFAEIKINNEDRQTLDKTKIEVTLKERECTFPLDSTLIHSKISDANSKPTDNHQERDESMFSSVEIAPKKEQKSPTLLAKVITPEADEVKSKSDKTAINVLLHEEPPKPAPRVQTCSSKEVKEGPLMETEPKSVPPKPAPRKLSKIESDSLTKSVSLTSDSSVTIDSTISTLTSVVHKAEPLKRDSEKTPAILDMLILEKSDLDDDKGSLSKANVHKDMHNFVTEDLKMAATVVGDLNVQVDEFSVNPDRSQVLSEDKWLTNRNSEQEVTGKCKDFWEPARLNSYLQYFGEEKIESSSQLPSEDTWHSKCKNDLIDKQSDYFKSSKPNQNVSSLDNKQVTYPNKSGQQESDQQFGGLNDMTSRKSDRSDNSKNTSPKESVSLSNHSLSSPSAPYSSSLHLPSDTHHSPRAKSPKSPTAEGSEKPENAGKKKLLQARVSPSETHPIQAQQSDRIVSAKHRLHPVKPMNTTQTRTSTTSSFGTMGKNQENIINELNTKKYNPSDPASAYAQLTHDELIQLVLKQKETISKKELQVQELEKYIDNLLVKVMEETPNILRISQLTKKAGKV
ncbi:rab11 family-interacting protein 1 [Rhinatrema bivittatum]|uniref:rab11 family-interacting protein 1 n=1 Tax=Rhinatrema bivittatum TaxID=194408 RepID=UPI00112E6957|nr:rab11 family-interacting protein 1 [Rhinatrema bivittatum]